VDSGWILTGAYATVRSMHSYGALAMAALSAAVYNCAGTSITSGSDGGVFLGGSGGSTAHAPPLPIDQVHTAIPSSLCVGLGACCASRRFSFSQAVCEQAVRPALATASVCPQGFAYDPQAAGDCVAAVRSDYAACLDRSSATQSICSRICTGVTPLGGACSDGRQCVQPAGAEANCSFTSGLCTLAIHPEAGEPCNGTCEDATGSVCIVKEAPAGLPPPADAGACFTSDGLHCASDWTCQPSLAVGSPCSGYDFCAKDGYCSTSGVCAARKADGQPCAMLNECLGRCDAASLACTSSPVALPVSAAMCANPVLP
jgi:hypothetical protein